MPSVTKHNLSRINHIFYKRPGCPLITRLHIVLSSQRRTHFKLCEANDLEKRLPSQRKRNDFLHRWSMWRVALHNVMTMRFDIVERKFRHLPSVRDARRAGGWRGTSDKKIWWNSYAASSTTVAKKNSVLLSLEMTTTGSRGVSSSSSLLPEAVFVGSSIPGATRAAAPSAVSANLATEYPLRDLSQKPLEKPLHLSCTSLFIRQPPALIQQVAYLSCTKRRHAFRQHLQDPEWQSVAVSFLRRSSQTSL